MQRDRTLFALSPLKSCYVQSKVGFAFEPKLGRSFQHALQLQRYLAADWNLSTQQLRYEFFGIPKSLGQFGIRPATLLRKIQDGVSRRGNPIRRKEA